MAGGFTAVDLSKLAPPDVVEQLEFEGVVQAMLSDLQARDPVFNALVESDPAYKVLEVAAYRELLLRQRVNEASRAVMLAYAMGSDLDQIAGNFGLERFVLDPGDPNAAPPVPPTFEADADLRRRVQLVPEGYTSAGPVGAYVFHALGASGDVRDVEVISPSPGEVQIYVLSMLGNGAASGSLVALVDATVNGEEVRPLCDSVSVESAVIVEYSVEAELFVYSGPDAGLILDNAVASLNRFTQENHAMGRDVAISGLLAALHVVGVQRVNLTSPIADIVTQPGRAAYCTGVTLALGDPDA